MSKTVILTDSKQRSSENFQTTLIDVELQPNLRLLVLQTKGKG
ncbi:hypothetical protein HMPREF9418_2664 [Neisseria macacae ATCC 33926]|uniref:Uncharacterized protein n=1 Tax=Neisseria macacae ATCC 33926 TaxID=997348 RepID=A0AA36XJ48_9NEIS|nr:hypothetical protein HMPREF9418_2664 [Neisseria macacae ATCC 33926]